MTEVYATPTPGVYAGAVSDKIVDADTKAKFEDYVAQLKDGKF